MFERQWVCVLYFWMFIPLKKTNHTTQHCFLSQRDCGWNLIVLKNVKCLRQLEMTHKLRIVFAFPTPTRIVFTACVCLCGRFSPSNVLLALCCPHFTEVAHVELWIKDSGEITLNVNWCRFFSLAVLETFLKHPTQFHVSVLSCVSLSL